MKRTPEQSGRVTIEADRIRVGDRLAIHFLRTLRVPEDGRTYPLPPDLGELPIHRVDEFTNRVPPDWRRQGGVFIPLYQREALWIGFEAAPWKPNAIKVSLGGVDAVSGAAWSPTLHDAPQDYLVCPPQPWLDGINAGDGLVRQFVATPLGTGESVEAQLGGAEVGGFRLLVFEPRPGLFPDRPPRPRHLSSSHAESTTGAALGVGAGGRIRQRIYPDPYGLQAWHTEEPQEVHVYLLNGAQYRAVTGREPPASPISARTYTQAGFPWFATYDEHLGDVQASRRLSDLHHPGDGVEGDASIGVPDSQVHVIAPKQVPSPRGGGDGSAQG